MTAVTRDTRYDVPRAEGRSGRQGTVQDKALVPKAETWAKAKLKRDERPPIGQSEEALLFRCRFRPRFQLAA